MRRAVIFDLDGCLVDSRPVFLNCMRYALDKLELPPRSDAELLPYLGPPFVQGFSDLLGVPEDNPLVAACIDAYRERYAKTMAAETLVPDGMEDALSTLGGAYALAVATSKPHHFAEPLITHMGLRKHFDAVAGPQLDHKVETKAETVARALAQLGAVEAAVMVGDRSFDVVGAHANGLPCIGVTWALADDDELRAAGADAIIGHPRELPGAVAVLLAA
jgi:phosphoglycolate phosphatase